MDRSSEVHLKDYQAPPFLVDRISLDFDIRADHTRVSSRLALRRNPSNKNKKAALILNGENQKLESISLNGRKLAKGDYELTETTLILKGLADKATLEIVSTNEPAKNTALSGLYASGPMLCTQCEAEGFRRITYYPDRPDVMARFRVTIHADQKTYPNLLSNGNLILSGAEKGGRHFALWEDPYPKPCYLFALVAGKLEKVSDRFITKSKRPVLIEIYVEPGKGKATGFALAAIKKSMRFDETRFGLQYDLDRFMMVATPFFNMGAMENKGLNIFNDSCVLGLPLTTTDTGISFIERIVGHEYFHNWTGDRITCRDWFQLSLKEGLTVFREQEFCGAMNSVPVERLTNVRVLRRAQFAEDASPMAHPVRPLHYRAIDNFYTATVYEKGAEIARMLQTLLGQKGFDKGMKLYVKRHDGQAVTCDDFVASMADANATDLTQFMLWYSQAGTPLLKVESRYDEKTGDLHLKISQSCPATPRQPVKKPMHIPISLGLLDAKGKDLIGTKTLSLTKTSEDFVFHKIKAKPYLSLLRGFSAPVRLIYDYKEEELLFLFRHDSDTFNRWEAAQKLFLKYLTFMVRSNTSSVPEATKPLFQALRSLLKERGLDPAFKAFVMALPSESEIGLALAADKYPIDPSAIYLARKAFVEEIARACSAELKACHAAFAKLDPSATDGAAMGKRSFKNLCLSYLSLIGDEKILKTVFRQACLIRSMTDQMAALSTLADLATPLRDQALSAFEKRWGKEPLVMDKWFACQASARRKDVLKTVQKLMKHSGFDIKNPNRVSALIGVFAGNNLGFHDASGSGYRFLGSIIEKIDVLNPQSAAGLLKAFSRWRDFEPKRRDLMQGQLQRLAQNEGLSANCKEIVSKSLA